MVGEMGVIDALAEKGFYPPACRIFTNSVSLQALLESEPVFKVVGEETDGLEALKMVERHSSAVAILNLRMPR